MKKILCAYNEDLWVPLYVADSIEDLLELEENLSGRSVSVAWDFDDVPTDDCMKLLIVEFCADDVDEDIEPCELTYEEAKELSDDVSTVWLYDTENANREILVEAIQRAREEHSEDDSGLSVTRRLFGTTIEWVVEFHDDATRHLTVLESKNVQSQSDDEIANLILGCWEADWDDILVDNPVGDYRLGSSDFRQRNAA